MLSYAMLGACSRVRLLPPWEFAREDQPNLWNWGEAPANSYADECRAYQQKIQKGVARSASPMTPWQDAAFGHDHGVLSPDVFEEECTPPSPPPPPPPPVPPDEPRAMQEGLERRPAPSVAAGCYAEDVLRMIYDAGDAQEAILSMIDDDVENDGDEAGAAPAKAVEACSPWGSPASGSPTLTGTGTAGQRPSPAGHCAPPVKKPADSSPAKRGGAAGTTFVHVTQLGGLGRAPVPPKVAAPLAPRRR